ncbi:restriction endonuclease subunit S [Sphingomonas sp. RS2018]
MTSLLPQTVEWRPLGEVCTLQRGFDLPVRERKPGSYPLVTSSGPTDFHSEARVRGPGVVTGRSGSIGNVFYVEDSFWPLNTALYVKDFHGNDPRYIFYLLQFFDLGRFASGAGVPTLNRNHVHDEGVWIATDLDEQKRIVAVLDQAFAALDRARALAEANLTDLEHLSASASRAVFDGVGGAWLKLGDMCEIYQPKTISAKDLKPDGAYIVFGANGPIGRYDKFNHEAPQLLVTCRGATCGSVNISEPFSWITGNAMVVRPEDDRISVGYLEQFFRGAMDWGKVITGAAQPQITRQSLAPTLVPVPDRDAQDQQASALKDLQDRLAQMEGLIKTKLDDIASLRQSFLNKAFAGELT